ncbi:MAG: SDR family NAD(P)-dependent oxidoreductase [Erysipelotrichaceae bacterium]|nr:SDR family NAD(P)-dependent oxidoreductase [Erysipelotrichaceae bacterium]
MKHIAIITGASSGMGREFALTATQHGSYDEIWVIARNENNLEQLRPQIDVPIRVFPLDLSKDESFKVIADRLKEEEVNVSLLINASGYGIFDSFENTKMSDAEGMIDLNCKARVKMSKTALPYMHAGSHMIQIASMAALQPVPYVNVYAATKAFVLSFARALNSELESRYIHCMAVCPYWTKTRFFDRAVNTDKEPVVKKYIVMYKPEQIVKKAWKDMAKGRDVSIYGIVANGQAALCKMLPHGTVMRIWKKQQKLM